MAGYIGSKASVVSSGAERKKTFAITTTTTVLTGLSYTPTFVHLFHNGVRLVDGTDYTATDGTSITLTSAAESGDEVVVISYATFQAADAYTKAEADSAFVSDPNGAVTVDGSGNVGIGTSSPTQKLMTDGNIFASTGDGGGYLLEGNSGILRQGITGMGFNTNGSERMRIDGSGRVTTPYQPAFRAHTYIPISSSTGVIVWQTAAHNIGNHYNTSNGTFTAPVNGIYHFSGNVLMQANSSTPFIRVLFRVNGSTSTNFSDSLTGGSAGAFSNYSYHAVQLAQSFYLYAGDTVQMWNDNSNGSTYSSSGYGSFSGFLAG